MEPGGTGTEEMAMEKRFNERRVEVRAGQRADGAAVSRIGGYAAVFYDGSPATEYELCPGYVERLMKGCFDNALAAGDDARCLFNHDPNHVLGRVSARTNRLTADAVGLAYECDLPDTQLGRDLPASIGRGDITGSSFSFDCVGETWRKENDLWIREITGVRLYDVGPVTFPAYAGTSSGVRGGRVEGGGIEGGRVERRRVEDGGDAMRSFGRHAAHAALIQARARVVEIESDQRG
jgi:uncharacterized protein